MKIIVIGNKGYGIDYGCCHIGSNFKVYECTLKTLGQQLYNILNKCPFENCSIFIEYNTSKSVRHPNK